jgi:hypothetical protein
MGKMNVSRILEGKPEGRRTLGRPPRTCEVNIKKDLREREWYILDLSKS